MIREIESGHAIKFELPGNEDLILELAESRLKIAIDRLLNLKEGKSKKGDADYADHVFYCYPKLPIDPNDAVADLESFKEDVDLIKKIWDSGMKICAQCDANCHKEKS